MTLSEVCLSGCQLCIRLKRYVTTLCLTTYLDKLPLAIAISGAWYISGWGSCSSFISPHKGGAERWSSVFLNVADGVLVRYLVT